MGFFTLTAGYRGSLISFLTAPTLIEPLDSIEEVVESPLSVKSLGAVVKNSLKTTQDPMLQRLYKKYTTHNNLTAAFEKVTQSKLIMLESFQMSGFRVRKDFTNK